MSRRRSKKPCTLIGQNIAPDPLVGSGNPPHRRQACTTAHPTRAHHRMVTLAKSSPSRSTPRPSQKENATVMLEPIHKVVESPDSLVIPCLAPESLPRGCEMWKPDHRRAAEFRGLSHSASPLLLNPNFLDRLLAVALAEIHHAAIARSWFGDTPIRFTSACDAVAACDADGAVLT